METKICSVCKIEFKKTTKYCSANCYFSVPKTEECRAKMSASSKGKPKSVSHSENISKGTAGKPKPWQNGINNINYGGKLINDPVIHQKFLEAVKERGQAWTDDHKMAHSIRMFGDSNAMRGKEHTTEYKKEMSVIKKQQYKDGIVKVSLSKISKPEKEIALYFDESAIKYKKQFHIPGVSYWYDFYLPDHNMIIEFQGDYWHANPNKYSSGFQLKIIGTGHVLVDDIWARDKLKKESAEQHGYQVMWVWESEYKKLGMEAVKCLIK